MAAAKRLGHIDGLRGLAAALVVLQHAMQLSQEGGARLFDGVLANINLGRFGVTLFFLISGLVVPFSIRGDSPLRNFALSRFFRLYPAYWLSLAGLVAAAWLSQTPFEWPRVLANVTMLQGLLGFGDVGPGYWTLFYELLFYFFCALLFRAGLLRNIAVNALIVLGLIAAPLVIILIGPDPGSNTVDDLEMPFFFGLFFLGMLLRRAFIDGDAAAARWAALLVPLTVPAAILLGGTLYEVPDNANRYFSPMALSTSMALPTLLFVLVLWLRPAAPRPFLYLGAISYSVYLFQDFGLMFLPKILPPGDWPIVFLVAVMGMTLMIAAIVYRFVERPMQSAGKRVMQQLADRDTRATEPASAA